MTTAAPSAANAFAMPAPIPFDAPVTTATFPFSFPLFICVPFICLERIRSIHEQTDVGEIIHCTKEYEQTTCDGPAKADDVHSFRVPFRHSGGYQQRADRNQTPQQRQKNWLYPCIAKVATDGFLR